MLPAAPWLGPLPRPPPEVTPRPALPQTPLLPPAPACCPPAPPQPAAAGLAGAWPASRVTGSRGSSSDQAAWPGQAGGHGAAGSGQAGGASRQQAAVAAAWSVPARGRPGLLRALPGFVGR